MTIPPRCLSLSLALSDVSFFISICLSICLSLCLSLSLSAYMSLSPSSVILSVSASLISLVMNVSPFVSFVSLSVPYEISKDQGALRRPLGAPRTRHNINGAFPVCVVLGSTGATGGPKERME